jgi:hypothetical protein
MNDAGSVAVSFSFGRAEADEFLRRIAEDDEYREYLTKDPVRALAESGITISGDAVPETIDLPSKEEVNWLFRKSGTVAMIKPPMPVFASCMIWGIWLMVAGQATELEEPPS